RRQDLAGKLQFAEAERASFALASEPAEKKSDKLPQSIKPQASRHDRIAFEVTGEKPEVRPQVELGPDQPLAVLAPLFGDLGDPVEHQHRWQRQLRAFLEQFAPAACEQVFVIKTHASILHSCPVLVERRRSGAAFPNTRILPVKAASER